ncbi:FK506-binding protein 2 precursor [Cordyceps militaris CM01]|uniref:peptidylprolyl isomerase n=1 Tax=Cordyceps militaris (strain CM01) TaxID=983644 RepID=G3JI89_CORMM|nr:FK506-binding protein 2 precursor [Cordyceps militaris CM01]EGX91839.1 FK506-binding protein 2 precursor [Cordyceps militaris CM01]
MKTAAVLSALVVLAAAAAELKIEVTHKVECERKTKKGDKVSMHYRGTLAADGSQFDASYDRGSPLDFKWSNTSSGRTLTIPPEYGYGDRGIGPIPGGATLIFETELVGIAGVEPPKKVDDDDAAPEADDKAAKGPPHSLTIGGIGFHIEGFSPIFSSAFISQRSAPFQSLITVFFFPANSWRVAGMAPPRLDDKIDILHLLIDHVNNKTSLYNLCLVSKRFNYVFSKRLWRRLELDGSNMNCFEDENKRAILFQTPNLEHVKILVHRKRLQSKYGRLEYPQWDSELSDLASSSAAEFDVSRDVMLALSRATCLKSLTLQFNQRTASCFFVKKEPGIESVWQSEMPGFAELRLRHFPLLSLTTLTRLTLLELSGHMGSWITWIVNILLQNEGLEHFSFSIYTPRGWDVEDNDQPPRVTFCFELCHKYAEKSSKKMKLRSLHVAWPVMFPDLPTLSQLTDPAYLEDIYMDDR